jgi:hypothetical protein
MIEGIPLKKRLSAILVTVIMMFGALVGAAPAAQAACYADASFTSKYFSTTSGGVNLQISTYYDDCGTYQKLKSFRVTLSGPASSIHSSVIRYYNRGGSSLRTSRSGTFYDGSTYSLGGVSCTDTCLGVYTGRINVSWATDPKFTMSDSLT